MDGELQKIIRNTQYAILNLLNLLNLNLLTKESILYKLLKIFNLLQKED